jgi:hypothetical protein
MKKNMEGRNERSKLGRKNKLMKSKLMTKCKTGKNFFSKNE